MKNRIATMMTVIAIMMLVPMVAVAENLNPGVLPPHSTSHGLTYGDWSAKWWQWGLGIPVDKNPILDTTGANCAEGQSGTIWFLAGTFGDNVTRSCTIPTGKTIFFPIINTVNIATLPTDTETLMRAESKAFIDNTTLLEVSVDGVKLKDLVNYRTASPAFNVTFPDNGILPKGEYGPAVSDGFWLMLAPLRAGNHEISIHGMVDNELEVNVIYHLSIVS